MNVINTVNGAACLYGLASLALAVTAGVHSAASKSPILKVALAAFALAGVAGFYATCKSKIDRGG